MTSERVLVVDDEPGMLRSVERVLSGRYRVTAVREPDEALARAVELTPALAIVDIRMNGMDGFELAGRLRESCPDLEVIFMTGLIHELDSQLIRSIRERAFYFIQKPFDRDVLLTLVARCLEVRRLEIENREYVARLEGELSEARTFQRSLLPPPRRRVGPIALFARCEPSEALSGDLYDFLHVGDGRVALLVADVSGHGVSAAMLVGVVKSAFRAAHNDDFEPAAVLDRVAGSLLAFDEARFVTVFVARLDPAGGRLEYVNAGHPPPLLWDAARHREELTLTGPLVSPSWADATWEQRERTIAPGARLLVYTDGLTEAKGDEGLFGRERLIEAAEGALAAPGPCGAAAADGEALVGAVLAAVSRFGGGRPADDDRTLLAAHWDAAATAPRAGP